MDRQNSDNLKNEIKLKVETNVRLSPDNQTETSNGTINILIKNAPDKFVDKLLNPAILLAIVSIILTFYIEGHNQKQREISLMPEVVCLYDITGNDPYFEIENRGLGPATIYPIYFYYDNEYLGTNSEEDFEKTFVRFPLNTNYYKFHGQSFIKKDEIRKIIWLDSNANIETKTMLKDALVNISAIIICKDFYGKIYMSAFCSNKIDLTFFYSEYKRIENIYKKKINRPFIITITNDK